MSSVQGKEGVEEQSVVPQEKGAGFEILKASKGGDSAAEHERNQVHLGRISTLTLFVSFSSYFFVCSTLILLFQVCPSLDAQMSHHGKQHFEIPK